ncbi:MAG: M67 family metallopeptidase [Anaerolineae bacterium]|nr:M67 family metallopeptidase [Anaerolineae bacterium]
MPFEVCGFLGGVGGEVTCVFPVPNIAPEPACGFFMEPQTQWNVMRVLSELGLDMLAIYHSHPPCGSNELSSIDIANACYPEVLSLLIVPTASGKIAHLRAFSIDGLRVSEVSIVVWS